MIRFLTVLLSVMLLLTGCQKPESDPVVNTGRQREPASSGLETGPPPSASEEAPLPSAEAPFTPTETPAQTPKAPQDAPFEGSTVTIVKSRRKLASRITAEEIEEMVRAATPDLDTIVKNGQTVVLKPNLVQMIVNSTGDLLDREVNGITTDWRVTNAIVKRVRELNPDGKVYIMEGSATGPTSKVMEYYHYTPEYIKGVDDFICLEEDCGAWQDFDAPEVVKVDLPDGLLHHTYYFNRILYEADVLISIPCLKTSSGVVVTAGIKNVSLGTPPGNLYGAGPDNPSKQKMVSHKITDGELDRWIYDYYCAKPIDYVVVDGLQGFQSGPIPMSQERKETDKMNMGVILGGSDAVAVDNICSLIVGWDPESVGYLNLFREHKGLGYLEQIRVKGSYVDDLRKHFTIKRPELGGVQIADSRGPDLKLGDIKAKGQNWILPYQTDDDAYKLEVFIDSFFAGSQMAKARGKLSIGAGDLAAGPHVIRVIAYDRFLNRTEKSLDFRKE